MRIFSLSIIVFMLGLSHNVAANAFKTEKWQMPNGVQVIFYPAMEVPMLNLSMSFAAGSAHDGAQYGLAALTSQLLNQGNAGLDATTVAEALADTGSQYSLEINRDMVVFNLRTLVKSDKLDPSIKTFAQIINQPDFPETSFLTEKQQQLMAIIHARESPEEVAQRIFLKRLYRNHPYAHPVNGTTKSVQAISKDQVLEFYKRYYVAHNAILVMVGSITSQTAHQIAEQLTRDLAPGQAAPTIPKAQQLTQAQIVSIPFSSSQTVIRLGQIGIDHHDPNYFPLMLGNYILGGGLLVSRLAVEVREKQGLTYGIDSQFIPMSGNGPFLINVSTRNKQAQKALDIVQNVLRTYIDQGPSSEEVDAAKHYLTGSFPLSLSGNRSIATLLLRMAFYHLPDEFLDTYTARINAITPQQVKQAFKQQIFPNRLLLVKVGIVENSPVGAKID